MRVLGIAGTAKNTGKTTTTASLMGFWPATELALTSIGYDGESKDNVTGLPKPRLHVPQGAVVVTARGCVRAGSAGLEVLAVTAFCTPLGQLIVARVQKPGLVVLAGPNSQMMLRHFIGLLPQWGCSLLIVDGALGRIAPMAAAQGIVIATGAARSPNLEVVAREAGAMENIMNLPQADSQLAQVKWASLLVREQVPPLLAAAREKRSLEFTGVVDAEVLALLLSGLSNAPDIIIPDPIKLLLNQELDAVASVLKQYPGRVLVRCQVPLLALTVNPFYPRYNQANSQYTPAYVDAQALYEQVVSVVSTPVVDVVRQGGGRLAQLVLGAGNGDFGSE